MSDTITGAPSLGELSRAAEKGPWFTVDRPWGDGDWIVAGNPDPLAGRFVCMFSDAMDMTGSGDQANDLRAENAAFVARLENDFRAGRLHTSEALAQALAAAREETDKTREALKLAMQFVDRCAGIELGFDQEGVLPATEVWDVCEAIAAALGIETDSDAYRDLIAYPPTPAQTDTTPGGRADG